MAEIGVMATRPDRNRAPLLVGTMSAVAMALSWHAAQVRLDPAFWWQAAFFPRPDSVGEMLFHYAFLPRLCVSMVAGAMLGLSGFLFQQVFRNPLAEPTTLGVSAGAYLALTLAAVLAPGVASAQQDAVALSGAGGALVLVFILAARREASPMSLLLAGLVVSLVCGTAASVITLFHHETLTSIFIWGSGDLGQKDWSAVARLAPSLLAAGAAAILLARPLDLLALGDEEARSLGVSVSVIQWGTLLVATALSGFVVAAVGVIGFVGLAAPALARLSGARSLRRRLLWTPLSGAALLWLADQAAQLLSSPLREWPTGILTAAMGAPLMLLLMRGLRSVPARSFSAGSGEASRLGRPWMAILLGVLFAALLACAALMFGESLAGWRWGSGDVFHALIPFRLPRVLAALAAGAMLAMAGSLMQRLTGNPMASPEVLGIGIGASVGVILLAFTAPGVGEGWRASGATLGAFGTLLFLLGLSRGNRFALERMLLTGIAISTLFGALVSFLLVLGDPRMSGLLTWMAGSTYHVTAGSAAAAGTVALAGFALVPFCARWLEILPLGEATAEARGIDLARSRLAILLLIALLTGAATLVVGPLSFVGLMAPHIARMAGFPRVLPHLFASAVVGAIILVLADWLGRNLLFPYQVPAGLLAAFVGGPYFMWLLGRRNA